MLKKKKSERIYTPINSMRDLAVNCKSFGDKNLYQYFDSNKKICKMSYAQFEQEIKKIAAGMSVANVSGKTVALIGETSPFWVASYLAIVISGGIVIPMDKDIQISEIKGFLLTGKADGIVYAPSFNEKIKELQSDDELDIVYVPMEGETVPENKIFSLNTLKEKGEAAIANGYDYPECKDVDRFTELLFTSGTTGSSKGVMLSEKNIISSVNAACQSVEFFSNDVILSVLPIHHTYELCCMCAAINYGMEVCINDTLLNVSKNIKLFKPTGIVLVPAFIKHMHKKVLTEAEKKGSKEKLYKGLKISKFLRKFGIDVRTKLFAEVRAGFGGRLVKLVSGGAALNPEIAAMFYEFGIEISEGYGITECSPLVSVNPYYALKDGSVGPTVQSCHVIIDGDEINEKGFKEGEILVKGDNVMMGYYGFAPEENPFKDGYFQTGDIGYMDQDGYIFITGRKKSIILSDNGKNVSPEELEEYLMDCEGVIECVVVGRSEADYDKVNIVAIIYPDRKLFKDDKEAMDFFKKKVKDINEKLPAYKKITSVELRQEEFEKTTSRKIKRFLVK